jgi:hypothetical protein
VVPLRPVYPSVLICCPDLLLLSAVPACVAVTVLVTGLWLWSAFLSRGDFDFQIDAEHADLTQYIGRQYAGR